MNMDENFAPKPPPYETIRVEAKGQVEWLTLDRPHSLNAMNPIMMRELQDYFGSLRVRQSEVRVVILRGAGRAFCAGLDISPEAFQTEKDLGHIPDGMRVQNRVAQIIQYMRDAPQPIISLVHGAAAGGGFAMVLASDVRIGTLAAKMNAAFIRIGLTGCDVGVSYLLPRLIGASAAAELILTGRFLDAERAYALGLFSQLVEEEALEAEAQSLADDMLRNTPLGLRLSKQGLNANIDVGSLANAIALEDRQQILTANTEDHKEALKAFLEKRTPHYNDR